MKLFCLITKSESGDSGAYVIRHPKRPTDTELKAFLLTNGCDKDEYTIYEHAEMLVEVSQELSQAIPKVPKKELAKWHTVGSDT